MERSNPYDDISYNPYLASKAELTVLLGELSDAQPFDDVYIRSDKPISVKSGNKMYRLNGCSIQHRNVEMILNDIAGGENVAAEVLSGEQYDGKVRVTYMERSAPMRFRINAVSRQNDESSGIRITMRSIKTQIPSLEFVGIDNDMFRKMLPGNGLVLVVGETGSGKTTTLATVVAHAISHNYGGGFISDYSSPTEYVLDHIVENTISTIGYCSYEIDHIEVGSDLDNYTEAVKNCLRSNPDTIILGELREVDSMGSAIQLALSGHQILTTLHAGSVEEVLSRIVSAFDAKARDSIRKDLAQAIRGIVVQRFVPGTNTDRVLLREYLFTTAEFRNQLKRAEPEEIQALFADELDKSGKTMARAAKEALELGLIDKETYERIAE